MWCIEFECALRFTKRLVDYISTLTFFVLFCFCFLFCVLYRKKEQSFFSIKHTTWLERNSNGKVSSTVLKFDSSSESERENQVYIKQVSVFVSCECVTYMCLNLCVMFAFCLRSYFCEQTSTVYNLNIIFHSRSVPTFLYSLSRFLASSFTTMLVLCCVVYI